MTMDFPLTREPMFAAVHGAADVLCPIEGKFKAIEHNKCKRQCRRPTDQVSPVLHAESNLLDIILFFVFCH